MSTATVKEWAYCLVSPKHAETTWLRIDPDTEQRAFKIMNAINIMLVIACVFTLHLAWQRYEKLQQLRREYRIEQIQIETSSETRTI